MRISFLLAAAAVAGITACSSGQPPQDTPADGAQMATVACSDAQILAARATDPARKKETDRARIIRLNRSVYFGALANVAELKCRVTDLQADGALSKAFDAARQADITVSEYEKAQQWAQAALYANQAAGHLIRAANR